MNKISNSRLKTKVHSVAKPVSNKLRRSDKGVNVFAGFKKHATLTLDSIATALGFKGKPHTFRSAHQQYKRRSRIRGLSRAHTSIVLSQAVKTKVKRKARGVKTLLGRQRITFAKRMRAVTPHFTMTMVHA